MEKEGMTYQEKKSVLNILSSILITGIYYWYVFRDRPDIGLNTEDLLVFWAKTILWMIPIAIVAKIVLHIVFAIGNAVATREEHPETDERDKMIELKATRNSHFIFGLAFVLALVSLAMKMHLSTMFVILVVGGLLTEIVEGLFQIRYYRRGL